ncbi:MAG: hypothetical protein ABI705_04005 [Aestuariivirga sp.]
MLKFQNIDGTALALACGGFLAIALLFHGSVPLTSDVSYFIVADGRILDGAVPYVDIMETNPPLAFWISLPAVWLARILGLSPHVVFVGYVGLAIAGALGLTYLVLKSAGETRESTAMVLLASAAALTLAPAEAFGQREHFAALLALPYVAAAAQLAEGRAPRTSLRIVTGLLCGVGMAFKPYLLAIPLLVEAFLLWEKRDWRTLFRAEVLGMGVLLAVYPFLVWQFTPQYFTEILPLMLLTYGAYQISFLETVLRPIVGSFGLYLGITVYMIWRLGLEHRGERVWIFAGLGGLICFLAQEKGWTYQLLPATTFVLVPFLVNATRIPNRFFQAVIFGSFGIAMIIGLAKFAVLQNARMAFIDDLFAGRKPQRMMALTHDLGIVFPYVETNGVVWAGRLHALWMLPAVSKEFTSAEQQGAVIARATRIVTEDLIKWKPDFVIVDRRSNTPTLRGHEVKYIAWFSRSPEFVQAWSSYKLVNSNGIFEFWELQ